MGWDNKVVWAEGMFLRTHHFQQFDRYVEKLVRARVAGLLPYGWGIRELRVNRDLLGTGKFAVSGVSGVMDDGTPFAVPEDADHPPPLTVPENTKNAIVYLAVPVRQPGNPDIDHNEANATARYATTEFEATDANAFSPAVAAMQVARLKLRYLLETDDRSGYVCLGLARIVEVRADRSVVLDDRYIPPCLAHDASASLSGYVSELVGLLHHRGEALAGRVNASDARGVAEVADFLLLQLVNRAEPLFAHVAAAAGIHPERLYAAMLELAGEVATFTGRDKRPVAFPPYRHDDLQHCFQAVMIELRQALSAVLEQSAVPIPLEERRYGIRVAAIHDRTLLDQAAFILAVRADVPAEAVRRHFPSQIKIGPVEQIRNLVNAALPGVTIRPLPVAPRQLPYHPGVIYFELDRNSRHWTDLKSSGGMAVHVAGEFPNLQLECWAIKAQRGLPMVDDDPFADPQDADRTVIRPRPGGARPAAVVTGGIPGGDGEKTLVPRAAPTPRPRLAAGVAMPEFDGAAPIAPTGVNKVIQAATPLFALAVRLKNRAVHRDVPLLRERVIAEIRAFERNALATGATADAIRAARYGLCATIDDLVLNTPWGSQSVWTKQSMVSTFYNETWGGERFFDILDHLMKDPERTLDILELFYVCLALGFEGRYRIDPRGPARLSETKDSLYSAIRRRRDHRERALSPHWVGVAPTGRRLSRLVPLWVVGAAAGAILLGAFFTYQWLLDGTLQPVMAAAARVPPAGPVVIERPAPVEPPPAPQIVEETSGSRLKRFLEPEIREGLVTVVEDQQTTRVRINGNGLFASASDTVTDDRKPILVRIGDALKTEPGQVVVEGHTDNQPIRNLRFPSNWQLSLARAESVRRMLADRVQDDARFSVEAKADTVPLVPNETADGRAQNRRIEVVLLKPTKGG